MKTPRKFPPPQKGLQHLLHDVMHDPKFVEALEADPKDALARWGYPDDQDVVAEISKIDFDVFRRRFGSLDRFWC